jgi:hypothetical protein
LGDVFVDGERGRRECGLGHVLAKCHFSSQLYHFLFGGVCHLASIGTLEGKVTSLSTMEANFDSLFTRGWSYIHDQYKRAMYTWFGAPIEIVTFLLAIVVLSIWWGLCRILRGLRP